MPLCAFTFNALRCAAVRAMLFDVRIHLPIVLCAASLIGCAHERLCPSPIGRITEDACERYAEQYQRDRQALESLGDAPIADQVHADIARLGKACAEFNACGRAVSAYDNERAALHGRIRAAADRVTAVPSEEGPERIEALNVIRLTLGLKPESLVKPGDRVEYAADVPWFGTRFLPPQPLDAADPALLDVWLRTQRAWGQARPNAYKPYATVLLRGVIPADAQIELDWAGQTVQCPAVGLQQFDAIAVPCAGDAIALTGRQAAVTVRLREGEAVRELGSRRFRMQPVTPVATLPAVEAPPVLIFHPADDKLPAIDEQPAVVVTLKTGSPPTARCGVDGQSIGAPLLPSWRSAPVAVAWHQGKHVGWWRYDFALPFIAAGEATESPADARWPKPGQWRCVIERDGKPVQALRFTVNADGTLAAHPDQAKAPRAAWLLTVEQ